jgi:methylthioribose-1-phosphate isomerase
MTHSDRESLSLRYQNQTLAVLDQTRLPHEEVWIEIKSPEDMIQAIQRLAVRGAPLIGVAAAMALGHYARTEHRKEKILSAWKALRESRPTAVNLMNCLDRSWQTYEGSNFDPSALFKTALELFDEDVRLCEGMAEQGASLIQDGDGILTHCNTGGLATVGAGTALAVIKRAHAQGKKIHVYIDETRPLGQGSRLTSWELMKAGVPCTLICDNMAGFLMSQGKVQKVFVGSDRIAVNGDCANKIGSYSVAVLASYHRIPFYIVAPSTTYDPKCPSGAAIPIEERSPGEVRGASAPKDVSVWNPAFDVIPKKLIAGIVLENRIWS